MPLYEYGCTSCGGRLERRQSFSDAPLTTCPSCGGTLYRVLQPVGIVFKGSGWYCTDSRSKSSADSSSTGSTSTNDSASSSTKTEKPKVEAKT